MVVSLGRTQVMSHLLIPHLGKPFQDFCPGWRAQVQPEPGGPPPTNDPAACVVNVYLVAAVQSGRLGHRIEQQVLKLFFPARV